MNQSMKRGRAHSRQPMTPGSGGYFPDDNLRGYTWGYIQNSLEKYKNLAQEAITNNDRFIAENCYQHIDHYLRLTSEFKERNPSSPKTEPKPPKRKRQKHSNDLESSIEQELMAQLKF